MQKAILAKKLGMTQIFDEVGRLIPVTVVEEAKHCYSKTAENDGYDCSGWLCGYKKAG